MLIMVMMLTAFAVVREREIGTLEQVMVTPIRRWEFILGKTLPFFLIGCFDATIIALVGTLWFGVPFRGNVVVLALGLATFIFAALGLGLLLSTISATQQQAMIASFFFNMPMITLSGFGTPISSMPPFFQKLTYFNPMRYVMVVLRSVYLKGVGLDVLWPNIAAMAGLRRSHAVHQRPALSQVTRITYNLVGRWQKPGNKALKTCEGNQLRRFAQDDMSF